jgi:CheY-like chemotaxis protein
MRRLFQYLLAYLGLLTIAGGGVSLSSAQDKAAPAPSTRGAKAAPSTAAPREATPNDEDALPVAKPSPLASEPKTPRDLVESAVLMANLGRNDLARRYLEKLLEEINAAPSDDELLLALRDEFGPAPFLQFARIEGLRLLAETLLDKSNAALKRRAADPAYVAALIERLDDDADERFAAVSELKALGATVVPAMIGILGDAQRAALHQYVLAALVEIGDEAAPPLLAALQSPSAELRVRVLTALGTLRSASLAEHFWHAAFSAQEDPSVRAAARGALALATGASPAAIDRIGVHGAALRLRLAAYDYFLGKRLRKLNEAGLAEVWSWDPNADTAVAASVSPETADESLGLLFARQGLGLAPDDNKLRVLHLALALGVDQRSVGPDHALPAGEGSAHDMALSQGMTECLAALSESITAGRPFSALGALRTMQRLAETAGASAEPPPGPAVQSLDYPDPRVQFQAANLILKLDPQSPFRGATRVVEVLARAAATAGKPRAIVGEVSAERAAIVGGMLNELGYETIVTTSGRAAFMAAIERTNVELVVLHPNLIRWSLSETLANLRADRRTAAIPILIHGPSALESRMRHHTRAHRLVAFALLTESPESLKHQFLPLLAQVRTPALNPAEQAQQRAGAVKWLAQLSQGRRFRVFDIAPAEEALALALSDDALAPDALNATGAIATRSAQHRLVDFVLDVDRSADLRKAARKLLDAHVQKFGLLVPQDTIDALRHAQAPARTSPGRKTARAI